MFILESSAGGYKYIDESTGDYFCAFYVDAYGGTEDYALVLGPDQDLSELDEIPF